MCGLRSVDIEDRPDTARGVADYCRDLGLGAADHSEPSHCHASEVMEGQVERGRPEDLPLSQVLSPGLR
jgi:hypothetical protein